MRSSSPPILLVVTLALIGAPTGAHASPQSYKASYYSKGDYYSLNLLAGAKSKRRSGLLPVPQTPS